MSDRHKELHEEIDGLRAENAALRNGLEDLLCLLRDQDSDWMGNWMELDRFDDLLRTGRSR